MRAPTFALALLAASALGVPSAGWAQSPPDKPAQAEPDKSDDVLSPSTLPKARQNVKEDPGNQVDALSPDEMRRLERIRAKAAAKSDAAKAKATKTDAGKAEAAKAEADRQEAARAEAAKQEEAAKAEAVQQEADRAEAAKQDAARAETARQEAAKAEAAKQETARAEAARQDAARAEAAKQEAAKADAAKQDAAKAEATRREAAKADAAKQAAGKQEAAKQAAAKAAAAKQASEGSAPPPAADKPAPRQAEIKDPVPQRKAATAPRARQATRRVRAPRDTADLDERRPSRRGYPPFPRRPYPDYAERAPRVGDVIPPGVPLRQMPYGAYGYGPRRFYGQGPYADGAPPYAYGQRAYPPYPRGDDDYGGPPQRRFYEEPF